MTELVLIAFLEPENDFKIRYYSLCNLILFSRYFPIMWLMCSCHLPTFRSSDFSGVLGALTCVSQTEKKKKKNLTLASYFHLFDRKSDAFSGYLYTHIFKKQLEEDLFPTSLPTSSTENSPNSCHNEARHSDLLVVCLGFFKMTDPLQCNILAVVFDGDWLVCF